MPELNNTSALSHSAEKEVFKTWFKENTFLYKNWFNCDTFLGYEDVKKMFKEYTEEIGAGLLYEEPLQKVTSRSRTKEAYEADFLSAYNLFQHFSTSEKNFQRGFTNSFIPYHGYLDIINESKLILVQYSGRFAEDVYFEKRFDNRNKYVGKQSPKAKKTLLEVLREKLANNKSLKYLLVLGNNPYDKTEKEEIKTEQLKMLNSFLEFGERFYCYYSIPLYRLPLHYIANEDRVLYFEYHHETGDSEDDFINYQFGNGKPLPRERIYYDVRNSRNASIYSIISLMSYLEKHPDIVKRYPSSQP